MKRKPLERQAEFNAIDRRTIDPQVRRFFVRRLLTWGRTNRRDFPWRRTNSPFRVLLSEVLLQRSRSSTVAKVYEDLFSRWPSAAELGRARISAIQRVIRPLGLINRATTIRALARAVDSAGGTVTARTDLTQLPGVGPYAAAATTTVIFDRPTPVVDSVSARVYRRFFGLSSNLAVESDSRLQETVRTVTPKQAAREWNWAALDLAALICLPQKPRCPECPLQNGCAWSAAYLAS